MPPYQKPGPKRDDDDGLALSFLDSDQPEPAEALIPKSRARRPWTLYWPPSPGDALYSWLQIEFPAVLCWRWDPSKPFDRPWQKWSQEARQSGRQRPSVVIPAQSLETASLEPNEYATSGKDTQRQEQRVIASILDDQLRKASADAVVPQTFHYVAPNGIERTEKLYHSRLAFLDDLPRTNVVSQAYDSVKIHDVTGLEDIFTLSGSGFQFENIPVPIATWDVQVAREVYLPAMESWLRSYFNSDFVYIYTYNFRSLDPTRKPAESWIPPFTRAHCGTYSHRIPWSTPNSGSGCADLSDVTPKSGKSRLTLHLPEKAAELEKGRYRMIGVWRPLTGPYQDNTLAVCDARTVAPHDLVPADIVFPHYCDEGYEIKYNANHRWFYKKKMGMDDVVLFKHFDSDGTEASFCPHTAFVDHTVPIDTPLRASIELRAIVIG